VLTQLGIMNIAIGFGGVVRNKVMAVYLKPAGFGEFTQLAGIATAVYVFVQFGMSVGLSRHAAAHREEKERQRQLSVANCLTVGLAVISIALIIPAIFSSASGPMLRVLGVVPTLEHKILLAALLAVAPLEALRNNYVCFLQGILDIRGMSAKRSISILVSTAAAVPLIALFRAAGAAAQMAFGSLFLAVLLGQRCLQMGYRPLAFAWNRRIAFTLAGWGGASLISGLALNSTDTLIRGHLIATAGPAANGLYQSASLLSGQVMTVILGSIGAYSLATLSETKDPAVARVRMTDLLRVILPITTLALGSLGLLSIPLLSILFTRSFGQASTFFPLQLSANYLQAAAWIVGAPLLGFGFVRTWMFIQLAGSALRYAVTILLSSWIGVHAVPAGLALAITFDLVADIVFCRRCLGIQFDARTVRTFLLGGAGILTCAVVGAASRPVHLLFLAAVFLCCVVAAMAWRETKSGLRAAILTLRRLTHT
jgi:PST family polysaccharide transporter